MTKWGPKKEYNWTHFTTALVHDSAAADMEGSCFVREGSTMPHEFNAKRRHKLAKARYRVRNWPDYDRALCQRGDLTLWIPEAAMENWRIDSGRGIYNDLAIEMALTRRLVFGLGLRQTEGFLGSVMTLLGLSLPVPDHTTLSRRGRRLELSRALRSGQGSLDIVVDSTGLGIHGPGEWQSEAHGGSARRQWRKLHIAIDPKAASCQPRGALSTSCNRALGRCPHGGTARRCCPRREGRRARS